MDVKKLFRRSKTPDGASRRNRLSFGSHSSPTADSPANDASDGSRASPATSGAHAHRPNAPPVPRLPHDMAAGESDGSSHLPSGELPIAAQFSSEAYYKRSAPPSEPSFGITGAPGYTAPTRVSAGSEIIPGKYDHKKAQRAALLQYSAERSGVVQDAATPGNHKGPNFSITEQHPATRTSKTPPQTPVSPRPGLSQHPVSPNDYTSAGHRRNLTQDTEEDGRLYEDAQEGFPVRSPLLETDTLPGFIAPSASAAQTPSTGRTSIHRKAVDGSAGGQRDARDTAARSETAAGTAGHPNATASPGGNSNDRASSGVYGSAHPVSLEGVVDLTNTVDTEVHTQWADPVYHDTVKPTVHHVTHHVYDRDIHNHHVQHRVLPIREVQQLPARHFVPHGPGGALIEVDEAQVPGRTGAQSSWAIQQTTPNRDGAMLGRETQSQQWHATQYVNKDGVPTTEDVWKHPPRMSDGTPDDTRGWPLAEGGGQGADTAAKRAAKLPREHEAERAVESQRAVSDPSHGQPPARGSVAAMDLAYRSKPQQQREREADGAIAAARAAIKHQ